MHTMVFTNAMATILVLVSVCLASPAAAFVVGGGSLSANVAPSFATHVKSNSVAHVSRRSRQRYVRRGVRGLNAAAEENEGGGAGFNPYSAFRSWQKDLVRSKAESNDKYPEAFAGLMKEPGMTKEKAERLARLAVSDPILYAIERRKEANEINGTPMDYSKIGGFFPMDWIMSGDFGWGFNKKKRRMEEEKKKNKQK